MLAAFLMLMTDATQLPPLETPWTKLVSKTAPHPEYPRPQLVREGWVNLNGKWDVAVMGGAAEPLAKDFARKILVPFPIESVLSGIQERVPDDATVWYRRKVRTPDGGGRLMLHFGAVDWHARVWIDDSFVGEHRGGYDPFSFDVTDLCQAGKSHEIRVAVTDPSDGGPQPRGKQVRQPSGIWYTPTTGIWQTVWMERVPPERIDRILAKTKVSGALEVQLSLVGKATKPASIEIFDGKRRVARGEANRLGRARLQVPRPKLWTPDRPHRYRLIARYGVDEVETRFGIREFGLKKDRKGRPQIALNGKPIFLHGFLDQGFWPDGLYTAPGAVAMRYDLEVSKRLGFNCVRKHVKVEPATWYAACDELGLIVLQDMPSGDGFIGGNDPDLQRSAYSAEIFARELGAMIDWLEPFTCIGMWVVFNEGWGQFETKKWTAWTERRDPTRLVNSASGWTDRGVGDVHDVHVYPGPGAPPPSATRALFLGEYGGLGLPVEGHTPAGWGYQSVKTRTELMARLQRLFAELHALKERTGLSGAIYTQTTDVETEINGFMTYDRKVLKVDPRQVRSFIRAIDGPAPRTQVIVATSELKPQTWRMTLTDPGTGWEKPDFNDSEWKAAPGGFGTSGTPGAVVGTRWNQAGSIWIRRRFTLSRDTATKDVRLRIHHDEDADVYLDGTRVAQLAGYSTYYTDVAMVKVPKILKRGVHTIAIRCTQTTGGQFIDAGLVRILR